MSFSSPANGDVTTNELIEGYAAYCPEHRWQPLAITEVQRQLEGLMLEILKGVVKGVGPGIVTVGISFSSHWRLAVPA